MAIEVRCFLDDLLLEDEPIGLSGIQLSLIRDNDLHGIGFEASTSPLEFISNGMEYLEFINCTQGQKASVIFKADLRCSPTDEFETIITGKINMSNLEKDCGTHCSILAPIESVSCEMLLKNRFDQDVDLDATVTFNKLTALVNYDFLNIQLLLPTRELDYKTEGYVKEDAEDTIIGPTTAPTQVFVTRPDYANIVAQNIKQSELTGSTEVGFFEAGIISPAVLFDENIANFPNPFVTNSRMKGNISWTASGQTSRIYLVLMRGIMRSDDYAFTSPTDYPDVIEIVEITTPGTETGPQSIDFDHTFATYNWAPRTDGEDGIYSFLYVNGANDGVTYTIHFDVETGIKIETTKDVPPTDTAAYMVHETLSRIVESVTDNCCRVKSSYYGRTDSQPFSFPQDGCGALRFLTSGLKIRNAKDPRFSLSPQDAIQGLQAIDNIGMGIEPDDTRSGGYVLRVEDLGYFYQDVEMMRCESLALVKEKVEASRTYSTFNTGYKKWETQVNFGLDEYNSNRIYRTSITSVKNKLEKTSNFVAGEYPIELTREQQFAATNEADTSYDNEVFIICLKRLGIYGYPYGGLVVEQGNVNTPVNIFSPASTYNYRISPARNAMRWFRTVMAGYPNIQDSDNRLYFTDGTGNLLAQGILTDAGSNPCTLEKVPIKESQDLLQTLFQDVQKATPIWRNVAVTFDAPMSIGDYQRIKADPYGYISYQCGNGEFQQAWLVELKFQPFLGKGSFTLRKRWVDRDCGSAPTN